MASANWHHGIDWKTLQLSGKLCWAEVGGTKGQGTMFTGVSTRRSRAHQAAASAPGTAVHAAEKNCSVVSILLKIN